MESDIIDRIYEAAALPELWPDVLQSLATEHGFAGGGVITLNERFTRGAVSPSLQNLFDEYREKGWAERNIRAERVGALNYPGFVRDQDYLSDEEIASAPMYVELLRPHGLGWGAGSIVVSPNGDQMAVAFERAHALGPTEPATLEKLDQLRPHLARAALFSGRLDIERSKAQVDALSDLGIPAAVLSADGRTMAVNGEFEALTAQIAIAARDVVRLWDPSADGMLQDVIQRPVSDFSGGRSIPLKAVEAAPAAVLHALPIRRAARDVFTRSTWLLAVTPLQKTNVADPTILCGLYDLTPAEARVAGKIIEGETVAGIASVFGLSEATVRTQLRGVFAKTGTTRQSELVGACGGVMAAGRD